MILGVPPDFVNENPSVEFKKDFIKMYLEFRNELNWKGKGGVTEEQIDQVYTQTCKCELVSGMDTLSRRSRQAS